MQTTCMIAKSSDINTLLGFVREYYEFDRIPYDERVVRPALETLLKDSSLGRVYLVRHEGEVAGYFVLTFDYGLEYGGREVFIDERYVRTAHRGRGMGRKGLEYVEEVCRSLGVKALPSAT